MIVASQWPVLALVRAPYPLPVQRLVPWSLTGNSQSNAPHLISSHVMMFRLFGVKRALCLCVVVAFSDTQTQGAFAAEFLMSRQETFALKAPVSSLLSL